VRGGQENLQGCSYNFVVNPHSQGYAGDFESSALLSSSRHIHLSNKSSNTPQGGISTLRQIDFLQKNKNPICKVLNGIFFGTCLKSIKKSSLASSFLNLGWVMM
jgi:hypothetical protein